MNEQSTNPSNRETLQITAIFMPKTNSEGQNLSDEQMQESKVSVDFNPETLDITFSNSIQKGQRNQPAQVVTESTGKLSMDLIFDTTLEGVDVRTKTIQLARLMDPAQGNSRGRNSQNQQIPAIVVFQWGTIWFEGYIDTYKETLEFFSAEGVPLRAAVSLSMTQNQRSFDPNQDVDYDRGRVSQGDVSPSNNAPVQSMAEGSDVTQAAQQSGDPKASRRLAEQNGIENMRNPETNELVIADTPSRNAANMAPQIGSQLGGNTGLGMNASAQVSLSQALSAGQDTQSLFGKLENGNLNIPITPRKKLSANIKSVQEAMAGIPGAGASFSLGGKLKANAQATMKADVGINADIKLGIQFEE